MLKTFFPHFLKKKEKSPDIIKNVWMLTQRLLESISQLVAPSSKL